jgi:Asp-tRNA(Asn)/Glu-tRNA(Gln) amidotransferase A subunit family amidase
MLPLCQGSDTGGSLRSPATWCGVTALRPTPGLVPFERRALPFTNFQVQGPMARTVADTALFLSAMAGPDGADPMAFPAEGRAFAHLADVDLGRLRVAVSEDLGCAPMDDGIRTVFRDRVSRFRSVFAACQDRDPDFAAARDVFWVLRCVHFLANHEQRYDKHRDKLSANIVSNYEAGLEMTAADVARANRDHGRLYRDFQDFFADIDILICPGNAIPPFDVDTGIPKTVNGRPMENYMDASLVRSALTLTGHPVVALPCGLDHTGAPFGFQVVGPRHGDAFVLAAAAALERLFATDRDLARPVPDLDWRT